MDEVPSVPACFQSVCVMAPLEYVQGKRDKAEIDKYKRQKEKLETLCRMLGMVIGC